MSRKVLFLSCQGIGNTILAFPVFEAFKEKKIEVHVIASNNGSAQLLREMDIVDKIYEWDERRTALRNFVRLRNMSNDEHYEAVYALSPPGRRENLLMRLIKAESKKGWRTPYFWRLLSSLDSQMMFWDESAHDLQLNRCLAELSENDIARAIARIQVRSNSCSKEYSGGPLQIGIQPFTKESAKAWTLAEYKEFLSLIDNNIPADIFLFGAVGDKPRLEILAAAFKEKAKVIAGESWKSILEKIRKLDLLIGIDSCFGHLSGMLGIPTCVFYGYTEPKRIGATGEKTLLIQAQEEGSYRFAEDYRKLHSASLPMQIKPAFHAVNVFVRGIQKGKPFGELESMPSFREMPFGAKRIILN